MQHVSTGVMKPVSGLQTHQYLLQLTSDRLARSLPVIVWPAEYSVASAVTWKGGVPVCGLAPWFGIMVLQTESGIAVLE